MIIECSLVSRPISRHKLLFICHVVDEIFVDELIPQEKVMGKYLLVMLSLVVAQNISARDFSLGKDEYRTQFSGVYNGDVYILGSDTSSSAMYELTISERQNDPCFVKIKRRNINTYRNENFTNKKTGENISCSEKKSSSKTIGFSDKDSFVVGIEACTDKFNDQIKGVRLYGATLNREKNKLVKKKRKEFSRPLCTKKRWRTPVFCPAGQVATKLRVSTKYRGGTALGLFCQKIQ